jgi:hypothetical protein
MNPRRMANVLNTKPELLQEFCGHLAKPGDETVMLFAHGRAVERPCKKTRPEGNLRDGEESECNIKSGELSRELSGQNSSSASCTPMRDGRDFRRNVQTGIWAAVCTCASWI